MIKIKYLFSSVFQFSLRSYFNRTNVYMAMSNCPISFYDQSLRKFNDFLDFKNMVLKCFYNRLLQKKFPEYCIAQHILFVLRKTSDDCKPME